MPGLGNSGPDHWQSHWERNDPGCERLLQSEWDEPECADWVATLSRKLAHRGQPVVLAAHSSACAVVAHWAASAAADALGLVQGALLVAPTDPTGANYPTGPRGFAPVPRMRLPFPSIVVAGSNDPYLSPERAHEYAAAWGSELVMLEGAGHINVATGFGPWPEGFGMLSRLRTSHLP